MMSIHQIIFCDEVSEALFGKLNFIGYNSSNQIAINEIPYVLQSTLIVEGKIHQGSHGENLSLNVVLRDSEGIVLNEGTFELTTMLEVDSDDQPFFIIAPIKWTITEFGILEVTIFAESEPIFTKSFKIIHGNAPYVRLLRKLESSSLITIGNKRFDLESIVGSSSKELILIDQFLEPISFCDIVSLVASSVRVKALVGSSLKSLYNREINKINSLPNPIEIKFSSVFHDRFIIVNETECFHSGHSIKDLMKGRISRYAKMYRKDEVDELRNNFANEWLNAEFL